MEENNVLLFREKSRFFLGRVKISISNLDFDRVVQIHEKRHVDKLVDVFRGEGCQRLDPWNHVPVTVSRNLLSESLQASGIHNEDLMREGEPLALAFSTTLQLLHGRRRLLAAEEYLWDKWWVAELYSDDLPTELKTSMCEQYSHSKPFCDGDIYRYILKYQREENIVEEEKWVRRLSNSKKLNLRQLRHKYKRLANGFDLLTPYVGIWHQLHLGCLGRLLPDKTPEEFLHYLERMLHQYVTIMGTEEPFLLDPKTVYLMETLIPTYSTSDAERIKRLMDNCEIFGAITLPARRQKLLDNILGIDGRILSFHTFFQDTIYLGACSKILRGLLQPNFQGTVREAFFRSYQQGQNPERIRIQSFEDRIHDRPGSEAVHVQLAYRQLFLAAMRDFPLLSSLAPLWDAKKIKPLVQGSTSERWYQIASLARVLGFRSERITKLVEVGSTKEIMALEFLTRIRPPDLYMIDESNRNNLVQYIAEHIDDFATPRVNRLEPDFTTNLEGLTKEQRCNRPFGTAYKRDRDQLYINIIYNVQITPRAFVTSLTVQRDIFICFFGIIHLGDIGTNSEDSGEGGFPNTTRLWSDISNSVDHREEEEFLDTTLLSNPTDNSNTFVTADEVASLETTQAEHLYATELNILHTLGNETNMAAASENLRSSDHVVLYIWDRHQYTKFTDTDQQKHLFENMTCDLADKGYRFISVDETNQIATQTLNGLWEAALTIKLVLAGPKIDAANPVESDVTMNSLETFFDI